MHSFRIFIANASEDVNHGSANILYNRMWSSEGRYSPIFDIISIGKRARRLFLFGFHKFHGVLIISTILFEELYRKSRPFSHIPFLSFISKKSLLDSVFFDEEEFVSFNLEAIWLTCIVSILIRGLVLTV